MHFAEDVNEKSQNCLFAPYILGRHPPGHVTVEMKCPERRFVHGYADRATMVLGIGSVR
jgi:hypothetical protein